MLGYANNNNVSAANAATGDALAGSGTAGATGALSGLMNFNPGDATDSNITNASKYADNPALSGMVDATMRDARRQVSEQALPGIDRAAAVTGNTNNSRAGIAQGLVERGLAEKTADVSAGLRGDAFNHGLDLASTDNRFNTSAMLDALSRAGGLGGSLAGAGVAARSGSIADRGALFDMANMGGAGVQAAGQASLDNTNARYQSAVNSPFDALRNYMSIIGSNNWGSQGSSTTTSTPSAWQIIGGLMGAGGSLARGFTGAR